MTTKNTHGGAGRGQGRKPGSTKPDRKVTRTRIALPGSLWNWLYKEAKATGESVNGLVESAVRTAMITAVTDDEIKIVANDSETQLERAKQALLIIRNYNRLRNDLDAYLFEVAQYGLGERQDEPKAEDYGIVE